MRSLQGSRRARLKYLFHFQEETTIRAGVDVCRGVFLWRSVELRARCVSVSVLATQAFTTEGTEGHREEIGKRLLQDHQEVFGFDFVADARQLFRNFAIDRRVHR